MTTGTAIRTYKLSELTTSIRNMFDAKVGGKSFWVIGEILDHKFYNNKNHHYFTLVENDESRDRLVAKVKAVCWNHSAILQFEKATGQKFTNSIQVLARVTIDYHAVHGLTLVLQELNVNHTLGKLEEQRHHTIERLLRECSGHIRRDLDNFITTNNSLSHRQVIQRLAVVSSTASEGYQDFVDTLAKNAFGYRFDIQAFMGPIQGGASAGSLINRLRKICETHERFDAVIMIRGGGSDADFLVFDDYDLCKEVAALSIPLITGLGHLKNQSIVDHLAHTSVKTPSIAATTIIEHNRKFEEHMLELRSRIVIQAQRLLSGHKNGLVNSRLRLMNDAQVQVQSEHRCLLTLKQKIAHGSLQAAHAAGCDLRDSIQQLKQSAGALLKSRASSQQLLNAQVLRAPLSYIGAQALELGHLQKLVRFMDPVNLVRKGFALVYHNGKLITKGEGLSAADNVVIRMSDYNVNTTVNSKSKEDERNSHL